MKPIFEKINKPEDQSFYLEVVTKPYFTDLWHFHPEIEILFIKEGNGTKYVGDSINAFYPGDIVIIGSNTPHVWLCNNNYSQVNSKLMSNAICIQFMENIFEKSLLGNPEYFMINKFLNNAKRGIQFVRKTQKTLMRHFEELPLQLGMKRLIGLLTILDIMSTSNDIKYLTFPNYKPISLNSDDKDRMGSIFNYVIQNYTNKIFLEEIASQVNLTPQSFCRYFKSRTTKAFSTFVNEVRIGNSCKMLIEDKLSISQICFESGFNYLTNFNRQFKKLKSMTPSDFKRKYNNQNLDF